MGQCSPRNGGMGYVLDSSRHRALDWHACHPARRPGPLHADRRGPFEATSGQKTADLAGAETAQAIARRGPTLVGTIFAQLIGVAHANKHSATGRARTGCATIPNPATPLMDHSRRENRRSCLVLRLACGARRSWFSKHKSGATCTVPLSLRAGAAPIRPGSSCRGSGALRSARQA
jgi:hypothetical protein